MPEPIIPAAPTLVIGAGELGLAVINGLLEQNARNARSISILLRPPADMEAGQAARRLQDKGLNLVYGDLAKETVDGLAAIFAAFGTVICCTGFVGGRGTQRKITAAVLRAGVERYVPWQFGVDYDVVGRGSGQDVFDEQSDVRDMLRAQSATQWVIVSTGMFTSFLFEPAFGLVDLEHARVHALGSWDNRLTVTTSDDIGRLTAAILAHEPRIRNAVVYVAGDTFSYSQLAGMVEHHLGRDVERVLWDMDRLRFDVSAHPDDAMRKYRLAFARDTGVAWDKDRTFNAAQGIAMTDVPAWLGSRESRAMTAEQLSNLWGFARGDIAEIIFEKWFLAQDDLEAPLGEDLHWSLASADYRDRDGVWKLRKSLAQHLGAHEKCECASIRDLAAIPMGGDGLDERVFAALESVRDHGGDLWWLHLSKCSECSQYWMIAQEERIFDEYFLRRISKEAAEGILADNWPDEFITYERVLNIGHTFATPCVFLDAMSGSLIWSAEDLRKARPEITVDEIARLLGVTPKNAKRLLQANGS